MRRNSLRLRLLAGAAVTVFLALALAWAGISWLFLQHVERREADALVQIAEQVVAGLTVGADGRPVVEPRPADPRFQQIAGGSYWQATNARGSVQSQSLWDQSLPRTGASLNRWTRATVMGPYGKQLTMVSRQIRPDERPLGVTIRVASDNSEVRSAVRDFDRVLALSLALLWLVLSIAAYVQVSLGLKPLDRLRRDLERLRRSPSARLSEHHPHEIHPLIEAINAMATAREGDLGRARRRAADLAHGLKTPLAVVAAQSRRVREAGADGAAESLDRAVEAVGAALEAELARSRAAAARGASGDSDALDVVEGLVAVIERTEEGEAIAFSTDIAPGLRAPVDGTDLAEMLGALIENATRHARRQVRIEGREDGETIVLRVEDDGPGMDASAIEVATQRGVRIDERGSGHGLGLSIVRDMADATEARFRLGTSPLGGLAAELRWTSPDHPPKRR